MSRSVHWRNVLYRRDPHCHWCGVLTFNTGGTLPRIATLDHVKSRGEVHTHSEWRSEKNLVIACHRCNQQRNDVYLRQTEAAKQALAPVQPPAMRISVFADLSHILRVS